MLQPRKTIWVLGDQLNPRIGALAAADPTTSTVLLVESEGLLGTQRHRQRLHFVIAAMRRFADELRAAGFDVDLRRAPTLEEGVRAHVAERDPASLVVTEPNSRNARALAKRVNAEVVRSNQFLCHYADFATWASPRKTLRMEDFYRWQRTRLNVLMDDGEPVGGRWNFDAENRKPPPKDPSIFSRPLLTKLDTIDAGVLASLPGSTGADPIGIWATDRAGALARLHRFVDRELPRFGPYEDASTKRNWHLAHSLLSPYLNLGLLMPDEVYTAAQEAYRRGRVPLQSAEGFIRQIIGWREYVWGLYWLWPDHVQANVLDHQRSLPPVLTGEASTDMACVSDAVTGLRERAFVHHIQRLMVLSNFANLYGARPKEVLRWMRDVSIDAADWVMVPNVMGMALWADGGLMASKPYVSGGAYINRMSDYCRGCRFDPTKRVGPDACPFSTLYWDFLARHRTTLAKSGRMAQMLANLDRLSDLDATRDHARIIIELIGQGRL